ncbi:MAG: ATP-binding protein [Cyanophyceae cyanobacterium]
MVVSKSVRQKALLETYRETFPIRTPGAIQPHGVLMALAPDTLKIEQVSQNVDHHLGCEPGALLGQPLQAFVAADQLLKLGEVLQQEPEIPHPLQLTLTIDNPDRGEDQGGDRTFDALVHFAKGRIILEMEPESHADSSFLAVHGRVRGTLANMRQANQLSDFLTLITEEVRNLTGFDRVMIYRFNDGDGAGIVEAESRSETVPSYRGLNFPCTDIPDLARELFQFNPLRLIPDIHYEPVPLVAVSESTSPDAVETPEPLDLGHSTLRQVSPCHIQYLKNMGVGATMVIPLAKNQELWGLITCHHMSSKYIPLEMRSACEFLGQVMCLELSSKTDYTDLSYRKGLQKSLAEFIEAIAQTQDLRTALADPDQKLLPLVNAGGAAVCLEGEITLMGNTPDDKQVRRLLDWSLPQVKDNNIFYTDTLTELYSEGEAFHSVASGLMVLQISKVRQYALMWFRPEVIQTVDWAGDPESSLEENSAGSMELTPRKSFEIWQETVHHCSLPWQQCEVDVALDLRSSLVGIVLNKADELAELNVELRRSNMELDSFAYAASHDLQEPLRGIHNYAAWMIEDYVEDLNEEAVQRLETIMGLTTRMRSLIEALLHFSQLGQTEPRFRPVDLNALAAQLIKLLKVSRSDVDFSIRVPQLLPQVQCDPVLMEEVLSNLIGNALKYNDKHDKWVEIGFFAASEVASGNDTDAGDYSAQFLPKSLPPEVQGDQTVFYVKDNGIGIRDRHTGKIFNLFKRLHGRNKFGGGTGAGLTITKKIVERHGGEIWVESVHGQGTTFYFTLSS